MRDLLYVPPGRTRTAVIGLLVPDLQNPIFPALAQAIETCSADAGFATILCNTACSPRAESAYVHTLLAHGVDGMIFISPELANSAADHSHYDRLVAEGARIVFVNGPADRSDVPTVGVDEVAAGELAAEHLVDLGHTRIGFVAGPATYRATRDKLAGLRRALAHRGVEPDTRLVAIADGWTFADGAAAMDTLLAGSVRPTAVIASSDVMAIGALDAARRRGLRLPVDLSVVGFDGVAIAEFTTPSLTTVVQPTAAIARAAVELLGRLIAEPAAEHPHAVFRPRLVARDSTTPPAA